MTDWWIDESRPAGPPIEPQFQTNLIFLDREILSYKLFKYIDRKSGNLYHKYEIYVIPDLKSYWEEFCKTDMEVQVYADDVPMGFLSKIEAKEWVVQDPNRGRIVKPCSLVTTYIPEYLRKEWKDSGRVLVDGPLVSWA